MNSAFKNTSSFNKDISGWDVSGVTDMTNMFNGATSFDSTYTNSWIANDDLSAVNIFQDGLLDISNDNITYAVSNYNKFDVIYKYVVWLVRWNTSLVTNMSGLFVGNSTFNEDISGWDVGNVTNMNNMFVYFSNDPSGAFNQPLNNWDVRKVTSMNYMFRGQINFNQPLDNWKTDNLKNTNSMFGRNYIFNQDISTWNVSVTIWWFVLNYESFNKIYLMGWGDKIVGACLMIVMGLIKIFQLECW